MELRITDWACDDGLYRAYYDGECKLIREGEDYRLTDGKVVTSSCYDDLHDDLIFRVRDCGEGVFALILMPESNIEKWVAASEKCSDNTQEIVFDAGQVCLPPLVETRFAV